MAYEKYIISVDEFTLALKYELLRKELIMGGLARFSATMSGLIKNYFEIDTSSPKFVQKNKIKFVETCTYKRFREGVNLMKEHGVRIEYVTNLQNIMR